MPSPKSASSGQQPRSRRSWRSARQPSPEAIADSARAQARPPSETSWTEATRPPRTASRTVGAGDDDGVEIGLRFVHPIGGEPYDLVLRDADGVEQRFWVESREFVGLGRPAAVVTLTPADVPPATYPVPGSRRALMMRSRCSPTGSCCSTGWQTWCGRTGRD